MLEAIFANPYTPPATARGAIFSPAPKRQPSPLEAFLSSQAFGKQQAGNTTPTYRQLGPAPTIPHQTLAPEHGAAPAFSPASIQDFYSDPANADYHADPALLGIRAADNTTRGNADAAALKARRQLVAQLGDRGLGEKTLGPDDETLAAISADPDQSTSVLARLARAYRDTTGANEDALNKANLFYSSERGRVLNSGAQDYATQQADAIANAQAELDSISSQLASVKGGADSADAQAEQDAFNRYMAAVAAHPPTAPGAGTGAGAPSSGGGTAPYDPATMDALGATIDPNAPTDVVNYNPAGAYGQGSADYGTYTPAYPSSIDEAANALSATYGPTIPTYNYDPTGSTVYSDIGSAADALASFLGPQQRKPLSGYAAASGSALH